MRVCEPVSKGARITVDQVREAVRAISRNPSVHVISTIDGYWAVRRSASYRAHRRFRDKSEAILFAEQWAARLGVKMFIHRRDGTVEATFCLPAVESP